MIAIRMNAIAVAETKMLLRNRLVAGCALLLPLAFGVFLFVGRDTEKAGGALAGVQCVMRAAMGTYITATTTLAARRQTLYLKRMRGAAISDRSIIAGLLLPVVAVNIVQVAVVYGMLASKNAPTNPLLLIAAVLLAETMFAGLALATAGFSNSPEHAQYMTTPIFLVATATAVWFQAPTLGGPIAVKRALPGGAVAELISIAWNGGSLSSVPVLLAACLAWAIAGAWAAQAWFRWEPRN